MAEFLVDKLVNALIDVAIVKLKEEFNLVIGVNDEVNNISFKLQIIRRMLQDVQRRKLKEKPVGIWLERLKDVAYDVDDVLDEWNTEVQKLNLKIEEDPNSLPQLRKRNKVCSFLLSICSCFKQVSVRHDIAQKIKELNGRMNRVFHEANDFKFAKNLSSTSSGGEFKRIITTSIFNESEVCDRENDKDEIVSMLLHVMDDERILIVSIVGMGGIGKTTLAQLVFNDHRIKEQFELRKWVCVSNPFDQKRIANAILEEPEKGPSDVSELETLLQSIKNKISGKKFLLVLDDVWTEDYSKWRPIRDALEFGASGSRILVTTRSQNVAKMMRTYYLHDLQQLSDSSCWKILSRVAFVGRSEKELDKFVGVSQEISKKCKGSPLAANFLGSLLQSKDTVQQWKNVLMSEIWEFEKAATDLFPHIYLSYNELAPEMKNCFLYCAVFPKDFRIEVQDLIRQWMAQGYISSSSREGNAGGLESKGYEYFSNLAMRSFFQNFERWGDDDASHSEIKYCKMHDLVHDFAQHLMDRECHIIEDPDEAKKLSSSETVRHLTWLSKEELEKNSISNLVKLRSFNSYDNNSIDLEILSYLKCLRVLRLHCAHLEKVPKAIGNLIHLRYLNLKYCASLRRLPEEICELYNLETLDVTCCLFLTQFPERIGKLRKLRHILNMSTDRLEQFPRGLEKLTSLQTLSEFKVGNGYSKFEYLRNLNQLRECCIELYGVNNYNEIDLESAKLEDKVVMVELKLAFFSSNNNNTSNDVGVGRSITEGRVQAPPNLEVLSLACFPNSKLPSWIMSLDKLKYLELLGRNVQWLPALGKLPSLEKLQLDGLDCMEYLGSEFLGITDDVGAGERVAFAMLKELTFSCLHNWKKWGDLTEEEYENNMITIMPCLEELYLLGCNKLKMLPHRILRRANSLKVLGMTYCDALSESYKVEENWIHISHIPTVIINYDAVDIQHSIPSNDEAIRDYSLERDSHGLHCCLPCLQCLLP